MFSSVPRSSQFRFPINDAAKEIEQTSDTYANNHRRNEGQVHKLRGGENTQFMVVVSAVWTEKCPRCPASLLLLPSLPHALVGLCTYARIVELKTVVRHQKRAAHVPVGYNKQPVWLTKRP